MQGADQHGDRCSDRNQNVSLRYRLKRYLDLLAFNEIMKNRGLHLVPCQWRQYQLADKDWFGSIARDRYLARLLEGKAHVIAASAIEDRQNPPALVANVAAERVIRNDGGAQRIDHALKHGRSQRNALRCRRKRRQCDELSDGAILECHPDGISLVARHHMRLEPSRNGATVSRRCRGHVPNPGRRRGRSSIPLFARRLRCRSDRLRATVANQPNPPSPLDRKYCTQL